MPGTFTLDEAAAATQYTGGFGEQYPVEDDHSAANAIDAAISDGLITSPDGYEIGIDLLANLDGELDSYRILVNSTRQAWYLASEMLCVMPGYVGTPDTMDVLREAVTTANGLLTAWLESTTKESG
jgi:hypothetical protein